MVLAMPPAERPPDEAERLRVLLGYGILDTPREQDYEDLVVLASTICGVPTSLITLIDENRQWFKAHHTPFGDHFPRESPREISFCAHAILHPDELTVIDDLVEDERFADNPLVAGGAGVRFYAAAPLVAQGHALGTICVADNAPRPGLTQEQATALRALARQVVAQLELRRNLALVTSLADQHRTLSESDPLTGLYNRRFFDAEFGRRLTHGGSGALLIIDLDGFKTINDRLGHVAGDRLLVDVARRITGCVRAEDFVARLGGDEFAVVLGRISAEAAETVADKLRQAVGELTAPADDPHVEFGASVGYALFERGGDFDRVIQEADRNMYAAKRTGRGGRVRG
jgi:diguanylate cyclase (GGDEF)-like protein